MLHHSRPKTARTLLAAALAIALSGCAGGTFTGPVEVTRFVAQEPGGLGEGTIALRFSEELKNEFARDAFRAAVGDELGRIGYTIIDSEETAGQIATIETSRTSLQGAQRRNPVNVGVGGSTGTFGSGVGVGIGINLGGSGEKPRVVSELSIAIAPNTEDAVTQNLWEGRAQFPTGLNSPYAPVAINARTLAAALFQDFPEGNGQTISIPAKDLVEAQ